MELLSESIHHGLYGLVPYAAGASCPVRMSPICLDWKHHKHAGHGLQHAAFGKDRPGPPS